MKKFNAALYIFIGAVFGFTALLMMMQAINGASLSWSGPIIFGSAILLINVSGHILLPSLSIWWFVITAAAVPIALCTALGNLPLRCWIFSLILASFCWAILTIAVKLQNRELAPFVLLCVIAIAWFEVTLSTIVAYSRAGDLSLNLAGLTLLLVYWSLIMIALIKTARRSFGEKL